MIFCDSSIAFYGAGNIGYRWAAKVLAAVGDREIAVADALMPLEAVDQHVLAGDFEGACTHLKSLCGIFREFKTVTVEDFEHSADLFQKNPHASPRLLLRKALMDRFGSHEIIGTFAAGCEKIEGLKRVNLMGKL